MHGTTRRLRSIVGLFAIALLLQGCPRDQGEVDTDLTIASGVAALFLTPAGGTVAAVVQVIGVFANHHINGLIIAPSHPDQNFHSISFASPVILPPITDQTGGTPGHGNSAAGPSTVAGMALRSQSSRPDPVLIAEANEFLVNAARVLDFARMADASLSKFYGALNAGDLVKTELQRGAACNFIGSLDLSIHATHDSLIRVIARLQHTPDAAAFTNIGEVLAIRDQIVSTGTFPAFEAHLVAAIHPTADETAAVISDLALVNVSLLSTRSLADFSLVGNLTRIAQTIDQLKVAAFVPPGFSCGRFGAK